MKQRAVKQEFRVLGSDWPIVIDMGYEPVDEDEEVIYDAVHSEYLRNEDNGHK